MTKNSSSRYHHHLFDPSFVLAKTLRIQKPIELLEAAVIKYLADFISEKNEVTTTIYFFFSLYHFTVGKFERVYLRKLGNNITEIYLHETEPPEYNPYEYKVTTNLVKDYLNGHELPNSLREKLEQNWIAQGKPSGDFEIWIQNVMKYGGYLDLPSTFRQGDKLYTPNELYTQRKKLYNSASSILLNGLRQDNLLVIKERIEKGDDSPDVQEEKVHYEPHPKWWPKRKSTKQKWALIYKNDIKYHHMNGENINFIANKSKYGRHLVSQIIQWVNTNPEELIR